MGTGSFVLASTENDILIIQSVQVDGLEWNVAQRKVYCIVVDSTHLMSKYLALLAMPPPLRKLSASMSDQSTCDGYRRGILTIADIEYLDIDIDGLMLFA